MNEYLQARLIIIEQLNLGMQDLRSAFLDYLLENYTNIVIRDANTNIIKDEKQKEELTLQIKAAIKNSCYDFTKGYVNTQELIRKLYSEEKMLLKHLAYNYAKRSHKEVMLTDIETNVAMIMHCKVGKLLEIAETLTISQITAIFQGTLPANITYNLMRTLFSLMETMIEMQKIIY